MPWQNTSASSCPTCRATATPPRASTADDPFGYLADHIRGMLDELGIERAHLVGNSYGGSCALRLALDTPSRVDRLVLMGPGGVGTTRGLPTPGLKAVVATTAATGPARTNCAQFIRTYLVFDGDAVPRIVDRIQVRGHDRPRRRRQPAPATPGWAGHAVADGLHPRPQAEHPRDADAGDLGPRRQGQQAKRRNDARGADAQRRRPGDRQHRPLGPVGTRRPVQRASPPHFLTP